MEPSETILKTDIPGLPVHRGKVRDIYEWNDRLLLVATDRISAFDVVLPTGIPDKGKILTQLSVFWFSQMAHTPHHCQEILSDRCPDELAPYLHQLRGRTLLVKRAEVIPIECVVRGYLAGSGWREYRQTQEICGIRLPADLHQCQKLPNPIFTPATKAAQGHDENISFETACRLVGDETMHLLRERSIALYEQAAEYALGRNIIIADTKFEWGWHDGQIILIDEVLTPDSSRFWPADLYEPGQEPPSFDKQYVRNYLETLDWDKTPPGPELPPDVVANTRDKYIEAYQTLTGRTFQL